jgi:hypothetical protein
MGRREKQIMIGLTTRRDGMDAETLATAVHDDILQSLGVAMLGVDLGRRLHRRARYEDALDELSGVIRATVTARASSEKLLPELRQYAPAETTLAPRPSLMVVVGAPSAARPAASLSEITETLAACELMARRCRHQYDAGLGEDTMEELGLLLQRLEFVAVGFRALMNDLRQHNGAAPVAISLARTA